MEAKFHQSVKYSNPPEIFGLRGRFRTHACTSRSTSVKRHTVVSVVLVDLKWCDKPDTQLWIWMKKEEWTDEQCKVTIHGEPNDEYGLSRVITIFMADGKSIFSGLLGRSGWLLGGCLLAQVKRASKCVRKQRKITYFYFCSSWNCGIMQHKSEKLFNWVYSVYSIVWKRIRAKQ